MDARANESLHRVRRRTRWKKNTADCAAGLGERKRMQKSGKRGGGEIGRSIREEARHFSEKQKMVGSILMIDMAFFTMSWATSSGTMSQRT